MSSPADHAAGGLSSSGGVPGGGLISSDTTFEGNRARESTRGQPDPIHWERDCAYRNQAYRHLHHQQGFIGTFQIRLLEAADLKRSHWSALALGPVKLLGLSKAHGAVSSYCTFSLAYQSPYEDDETVGGGTTGNNNGMPKYKKSTSGGDGDSKPKAKASPPPCPTIGRVKSPVIPHDDNPVWTNCAFELPLKKGPGVAVDGQKIMLTIRVDEDSTAAENILPIPGVPSGNDSRLLGTGTLDISSLCLGQVITTGQAQVGVLDAWVPIRLVTNEDRGSGDAASYAASPLSLDDNRHNPKKAATTKKSAQSTDNTTTGRVRVLVSYQPNGMEPQRHDIVALEAFARHGSNITQSGTCPAIVPALLPMHVLDVSGPWVLVEYQLRKTSPSSLQHSAYRHPHQQQQKACLRLHRNCVFVIERKNLMDGTINLALLPADVFMNTPLGQNAAGILGPWFVASRHLLMPALLSAKLVWLAVRTTTLASLTGVQAASSALWTEGSSSLLTDESDESRRRRSYDRKDSKYKFVAF
jgi:hypothetical protein